jgi:hypothetical protein
MTDNVFEANSDESSPNEKLSTHLYADTTHVDKLLVTDRTGLGSASCPKLDLVDSDMENAKSRDAVDSSLKGGIAGQSAIELVPDSKLKAGGGRSRTRGEADSVKHQSDAEKWKESREGSSEKRGGGRGLRGAGGVGPDTLEFVPSAQPSDSESLNEA